MRWTLVILFCLVNAHAGAAPQTGAWFDRTRDGHGMDWQVVGQRLVGGLFTFDAAGEPIWYQIEAALEGDDAYGDLIEFRAAPAALPSAHRRYPGLQIRATSDAADCGDGSPRPGAARLFDVRFEIDDDAVRWCLEPILPTTQTAESALSGTWYGGEADRGWGLITYRFPIDGAVIGFSTLYVYDAAGLPRWAFAGHPLDAVDLAPFLRYARGYCRQCPSQPLALSPAGDAQITLVTPRNDVAFNRIELDLRYPFGAGGRFVRSERALQLLLATSPQPNVVATREGLVEGVVENRLQRFLALPYVAPPVADLRWRAPQPALPRRAVLQAQARGPACPQNAVGEGVFPADLGLISEDCLQLNVWAPVERAAPLPVMLWLHGGGLTQGSAADVRLDTGRLLYDGSRLAADGVLVVSINYRLGPLGFLAMRAFAGEAVDHPTAGNYGLLDQIAALHWVRGNIAAFGGDPANVTIFGESAGGRSVCALLTSPLARDLFHRAIIQSGACPPTLAPLEAVVGAQPAGFAQGDRIVQAAGCSSSADQRACMRGVEWPALIALSRPTIGFGREGENFGHAVDGHALVEPPGLSLGAGRGAAVPLIVGINADEMTTLLGPTQRPQTAAQYTALVQQTAPFIAPLVLALYPVTSYLSPTLAYADLADDVAFACPARAFSLKHANAGNPTYRYVYTHVFANASSVLGAFHGAEIGFVFGPGPAFTAAEIALSERVQRYWTRFARSGDPNGPGDPDWPRRTATDDLAIDLDDAPREVIRDYRQSYCDFWSGFIGF